MTENKRFVQNTNLVMQNNEVYVVCGNEHSADVVATALNELINENEQLKSKLFDCQLELEHSKESVDDAYWELTKIKKENEKLKSKLSDTRHHLDNIFKYRRQMEGN